MNSVPNEDERPRGGEPSPRAFAQGTGVLLQTVGMILFFSTCCVCSLAGLWDPLLSRPEVLQQLQGNEPVGLTFWMLFQHPAKAGIMLMVMFMTVGGLAMAGFGLGLQSDTARSAWGALVTVTVMLAVLAVAGAGIWIGRASWAARLWHVGLFALMWIMLGFVWVALRQVLAHPPPADVGVLAADFKIPYSHYHDDPPDVRLAKELAERRARLEAEQVELDRLERELDLKPRSEGQGDS